MSKKPIYNKTPRHPTLKRPQALNIISLKGAWNKNPQAFFCMERPVDNDYLQVDKIRIIAWGITSIFYAVYSHRAVVREELILRTDITTTGRYGDPLNTGKARLVLHERVQKWHKSTIPGWDPRDHKEEEDD